MAIKTQVTDNVRRVITKVIDEERRVSCSCCAVQTGCCMYPASQLGVGYTASDLPDTLEITNGGTTVTATKSGSSYPFTFGINSLSLQVINDSWQFDPPVDEWSNWVNSCLITDDAGINVEDTFADTYFFTLVFNGNTIESGTITRIGLCVWSNTNIVNQIDGALFTGVAYSDATNGFGDFGVPLAWATYDGNDVKATKTPPHNSPEGTYPVFGGLYDGAVATVFQ